MIFAAEKAGKREIERAKWYGRSQPLGFQVFSDLENRYFEIFESLRNGHILDSGMEQRAVLPDLRTLLIKYGRQRLRKEFTEDQYIRKFYSLVPEINKSINLILEKVANFGIITGMEYDSNDPCRFLAAIEASEVPDDIRRILGEISSSGKQLCSLRDSMMSFLSGRIREVMPNTSSLAGEELAVELLHHAGSLRNMALMPASSIQVLGAEKALFKHFTSGTPPPKHGIIFRFRGISSLKPRQRGKAARAVSGKIAITARADYHGSRVDTDAMLRQLEKVLKR